MKIAVHLPQYGSLGSPDLIAEAARKAEALGFAGVWVSDHVIRPAAQSYPSARLFEPLLTLGWAAAATERIGLGTSVMVVPQYHPVQLANALATLDALSGGRLTLGVGVGWSEEEYNILDQPFFNRGARMDEALDVLQMCWSDDPVGYDGTYYQFDDVLVRPKPAHKIPIWVGGGVDAAYRRAATKGDGFHAIGLTTETAAEAGEKIRSMRPDEDFVFSLRTGWDPLGMEPETIVAEQKVFAEAGIQYVVCAPWQKSGDDWLKSMETLAALLEIDGNGTVSL